MNPRHGNYFRAFFVQIFENILPFRNFFVSLPSNIANLCPSAGGGATLREIKEKEALCSSCVLKPEKFHNMARVHDSFHAMAWMLSLSHIRFSQDPRTEKGHTVPRFSR